MGRSFRGAKSSKSAAAPYPPKTTAPQKYKKNHGTQKCAVIWGTPRKI